MTVITEVQKFMKIVKNENDLKRNFFKLFLRILQKKLILSEIIVKNNEKNSETAIMFQNKNN